MTAGIFLVAGEQTVGLAAAIGNGEGARQAEGVEAVDIAAGRQDFRRPDQVPARHRRRVAGVQRMDQRGHLMVIAEQRVGANQARDFFGAGFQFQGTDDIGRRPARNDRVEGGGGQNVLALRRRH